MKPVLAIAFSFITSLANAQDIDLDLPSLYFVVDVATNDVLNIRDEPNAGAEIIGSLSHDAIGVEIIARSDNGRWGLVNTQEQSGWTSLRFLEEQPFQSFPAESYSCFGTEPFWHAEVIGNELEWSAIGYPPTLLTQTWSGGSMRQDRYAMRAANTLLSSTLVVRKNLCSDGMSDRLYGLEVDMVVGPPNSSDAAFYSGCCSLRN